MLTPSKRLYYAVEVVLYIAYYCGKTPVSSRDVAIQQGLPPRHLEQMMQKLVRGKVLKGQRGPKGGYRLARSPQRITVGQICKAVNEEKPISALPPTTILGQEVIRPFWEVLHTGLWDRLYVVTVHDLCEQADKKNLQDKAPVGVDSVA
jgi:Rrf2 family transcriptional regulator, iron-sulfur cluster assembly transcription factor